ncbi:MAG TPA: hypothetical protein VH559_14510 [Gemmatimonadaceae bacterium]|jgi:hypothetical protein
MFKCQAAGEQRAFGGSWPNEGVAPAASLSSDTASVRSFVQGFYDWYFPIANKPPGGPAYFRVLQVRDSVLTPELAAALGGDSLAKERADPGDLEGLNGDPFLNSQDPYAPYEVTEIRQKGSNYAATVHPCHSADHAGDVAAEVTKQGPSWRFVNFFYETTDLRKVLCQYAKEAHDVAWQKASC